MKADRQREIWLRVADIFDKPPKKRSLEEQTLAQFGLCYAVLELTERVGFHTMMKSLYDKRPKASAWYLWPVRSDKWLPADRGIAKKRFYRRYDKLRAKLARQLAA